MSNSTINHIPFVPQNTLDPAEGLNDAIRVIDALMNTRVDNMTQDSPTSSDEVDGICFVVSSTPIAEWSGHANAIAQYVAEGSFWNFYEAGDTAWLVLNKSDGNLYKWNSDTDNWEQAAGIGEAPIDGNFYGRQNGAWGEMPDVSHIITSINGMEPDTSGEIELNAEAVPFDSDTTADIEANNVADALNELGARPIATVPGFLQGINDQTAASYEVALSDAGKDIRCTHATAISLQIGLESDTGITQGFWCLFSQGGAGTVTPVALNSFISIHTANGAATIAVQDARGLEYLGDDEWRVW